MKIYRAKAPLRLGFGGGGSDLPLFSDKYGGCVLNATIDKYVHVSLKPTDSDKISITSEDYGVTIQHDANRSLPYDGKLDLVKAAINRLKEKIVDHIPGFDLLIRADMPPGAGLGTSSTVVVAILGVIKEWLGIDMTEQDLAHMAYMIERVDMELAGGKQDQYAASCGGFNFMEFYQNGKVIINPLRIKPSTKNELQESIVLCYTGFVHKSEDLIEKQQPNDEHKIHLMQHIKSMAISMRDCLLCGDLYAFGTLMSSEWDYKKQLSMGITTPALETMERIALDSGAVGIKLTGAGGGGLFMVYTDWKTRTRVARALQAAGGTIIDYSLVDHGLETWKVNYNE